MSYKNYINSFGDERVKKFKEKIVKSKEFSEAFLDTTSHVVDTEKRISIFDDILGRMCEALGENLEEEEITIKNTSSEPNDDIEKKEEEKSEMGGDEKKDKHELEKDIHTNKPDLSQSEQELVEVIVRTFDGYNYETKYNQGNIKLIFKQNATPDLVRKWTVTFPENQYKGIKMDLDFKV